MVPWEGEMLEILPSAYTGGDFAYETKREALEEPGRGVYTLWARGEGHRIRAWWDVRVLGGILWGYDLDGATNDVDVPLYYCARLNIDGGGGAWDYRIDLEDMRAFGSQLPQRDVESHFDIAQAFVRLCADGSGGRVRLGRFRPEMGSGRLIGQEPDIRVGRSVDGAWVTLSDRFWYERPFMWGRRLDAWMGWDVKNLLGGFQFEYGPNFHAGLDAATRRWFPIEVGGGLDYALSLADEAGETGSGRTRMVTLSARAAGEGLRRGFEFESEIVLQTGWKGGERHLAWGFYGELGHTFPTPWKPRAVLAVSRGSGDSDPADGKSGRLYLPSGGLSLDDMGLLGRAGWPNSGSFQLRVSMLPQEKVQVALALRSYHLDEARDGWYDALGNEVASDPAGLSGTHVGFEVDLWADWLIREGLRLRAGFGWLKPGQMPQALGLTEKHAALFAEVRALF